MLRLIRAAQSQMKDHQSKSHSADEISVLAQRGGNPLARLEFKQNLPVIKDSDLDFDRHMREF